MTTLLALGDSFTCGQGVGVSVPLHLTWTARLAAALPGGRVVHLAAPGARVRDVRRDQLPRTVGGELATLLVGLNDVARGGFDATRFRTGLLDVVRDLLAPGRTVLLGRLHDPCRLLTLPSRLRDVGRRRVAEVNAAVDEAAALPGVVVLDLAAVPVLAGTAGWAVDRVHPSAAGHVGLAASAAVALRRAGWAVGDVPSPEAGRGPSVLHRTWWLGAHGIPYLAGHLPDMAGPAVTALLRPT